MGRLKGDLALRDRRCADGTLVEAEAAWCSVWASVLARAPVLHLPRVECAVSTWHAWCFDGSVKFVGAALVEDMLAHSYVVEAQWQCL